MDLLQEDDPLGAALAADQATATPPPVATAQNAPAAAAVDDGDLLGAALARDAAANPPSAADHDDPLGAALARDAANPEPDSAPPLTVTRSPAPAPVVQPAAPTSGIFANDPADPNNAQAPSLSDLNDVARMAADGASLGFADRLAAGFGAATGIGGKFGDYSGNLAAQRAEDANIKTKDPGVAALAQGAGSVAGLAVPGGAVADAVAGAPLAAKATVGALSGGAVGGMQGASATNDLTNLPALGQNILDGAKIGAPLGAAFSVLGSMAGGIYRAAAPFLGATSPDGMSRVASGLLANATSPATPARLAALGPNGMIADTSPSALGLVQGIAAKGGAPSDLAVGNLANRAAGQSNRLLGSLDDNLGPAFSPRQADAMMTSRQAATSPMYEGALRNAPYQVDISPVQRQLDNEMISAKGGVATDLGRFQGLLQSPYRVNGVVQPEYEARALHGAKEAMDVGIARTMNQTGSAASKATGAMVRVRSALNSALEDQVPGYADANLAYRTAARGAEAFDAGRQALKPGADTLWPQDLDHQFATMPLEQQALMRAGARSDIAAGLGTNANDLSALNKVVGGENDFNRPKMATLFGPEQSQNVVRDVNNERTFADTYNKVAQGSQTAQRSAHGDMLSAAEAPQQFLIPKTASIPGLLGHAGEYLVRKGFGALAQSTGNTTRQQLAQALTAQGAPAAQNLQDLARALMSYNQTAAGLSRGASNPALVAAGLAAYRSPMR